MPFCLKKKLHAAGTVGWACLILFGAPDDGADTVRLVIVSIGAVIALLAMAFYLCTACTDPGIVFRHLATSPRVGPGHHQQQQQWGGGGFGVGSRSAEMVRWGEPLSFRVSLVGEGMW